MKIILCEGEFNWVDLYDLDIGTVYNIPEQLEKDLQNWLSWAEKQNERNKKWADASNAVVPKYVEGGGTE